MDNYNPVSGNGWFTTEKIAALIIASALAFLILVRHGFRGISVGGVSVGVS